MSAQDNAVQAGAERLEEIAKDMGAKCQVPEGTRSTVMLERALAIAYADVLYFRGANDTPERLQEVTRLAVERLTKEIGLQAYLRKGHKSFIIGEG